MSELEVVGNDKPLEVRKRQVEMPLPVKAGVSILGIVLFIVLLLAGVAISLSLMLDIKRTWTTLFGV